LNAAQNHLIELLPAPERARLLALCESVELVFGQVLQDAGTTTDHVYFPVDGFISLLTQVDGHSALEVGMVGREGMVGVQLVLGVNQSPLRVLVQGAGAALRIGVPSFRQVLAKGTAMQTLFRRYTHVLMTQTASSAGCLQFHHIAQRMARWLLMSQDRAHHDQFHITHEFLAGMLGVRRVGITLAAGDLARAGLIAYHRGQLKVLDRHGLEQVACSCYLGHSKLYAHHIG
jgi:CRP-like cAMP-binding protein